MASGDGSGSNSGDRRHRLYRVGFCRTVCNVQCIAIHHDTKPLGVFTELQRRVAARLRRCQGFVPGVTRAFAGDGNGTRRNEDSGRMERGRRVRWPERAKWESTEQKVEKVLSNAVVLPWMLRNTIILVTLVTHPTIFASIRSSRLSLTGGSYNSPQRRTEVGDLRRPRTCEPPLEGSYRAKLLLRLLTTPNRFRFEHDSYIKG